MTLIEEDYRLFDEIIDDVYADSIRIRPRLARTLDLRDEPLSDLHDLQVYLIAQRRQALEEDRDDDAQNYFALLTETVNAIAMAERATG